MGMFLQTNVRTNEFNFYCGKMINTIPQSDSNSSKNFIVFMFESTTDSRRLPLVLGLSDSASLRFSPPPLPYSGVSRYAPAKRL